MINESGANQDGKSNVSPFAAPNIPRPTNQPSGKRKQWGVDAPSQKTNVIGTNFLDSNTPDTIARKDDLKGMKPFSLSDSDEDVFKKKPAAFKEEEVDSDYSDSFEEVNNTVETVP